ncbi:Scarecrow-like protein 14 [Forsythia ovata]
MGHCNPVDVNTCDGDTPIPCDYFDGVYEYINQMLMEEDDWEHMPLVLQDCSALEATEKYFCDALRERDFSSSLDLSRPPSFALPQRIVDNSNDESTNNLVESFQTACYSNVFNGSDGFVESPVSHFQALNTYLTRGSQPSCQSTGVDEVLARINDYISHDIEPKENHLEVLDVEAIGSNENLANGDTGRKTNHSRDNSECVEGRNSKQLATYAEEFEQTEKYDKTLLCPKMNPGFYNESPACHCEESSDNEGKNKQRYRKPIESKRGRPRASKVSGTKKEVIDLRSLLTRCAQAMADNNTATANEFLKQIRQYSSPYGNATERLAHCFANALEARVAGTGSALYTALTSRRIPAAELLKAYQTYVAACPFKRMSNIFANKSIGRLTREATRIHIIDFGILYGFQWPCLIQGISLRPGGSPLLRITGIDFPQPGFRPAEGVEQTGRHLMNYCKRFNVPFEYNAIAKKWDTISLEDLKIERDEMVVVNCMYRLRCVPDESAGLDSQRDDVLNLIRKINPDLFIHGIVNGTYNASIFTTRFREALYHYSSLFDMLDNTIPREDQNRLLYEREEFGRDVMNVIACEGPERIERPETYKKWQVRNLRAGFRQLSLNQDIVKEVKAKVRKGYNNDFLLDEDSDWMLQGWKGRVMYALSCWMPVRE